MADVVAEIGVLGGSGLSALLEDAATRPESRDGCACAQALDGLSPDPALP